MSGFLRTVGLLTAVAALAACSGGGGDDSNDDSVTSGVSGNFVADSSPTCPGGGGDTVSLRKVASLGRTVNVAIQVTDCDSSLGIYGVNFDLRFDPALVQCLAANPCAAGTLLSSPLATSAPQCACDNGAGILVGTFTKRHPGGNDTIAPGGSKDIVSIAFQVTGQGASRLDFTGTGSINGTALVTLNGGGVPEAIGSLGYSGGSVTGQ